MRLLSAVAAAVAATLLTGAPAGAGTPTFRECQEGSEFIRNAARARDAGVDRAFLLDRMAEDFRLIRAFPVALRWFAKDEQDESFLLAAATEVFDRPREAGWHEGRFLSACAERALVTAGAGEDE